MAHRSYCYVILPAKSVGQGEQLPERIAGGIAHGHGPDLIVGRQVSQPVASQRHYLAGRDLMVFWRFVRPSLVRTINQTPPAHLHRRLMRTTRLYYTMPVRPSTSVWPPLWMLLHRRAFSFYSALYPNRCKRSKIKAGTLIGDHRLASSNPGRLMRPAAACWQWHSAAIAARFFKPGMHSIYTPPALAQRRVWGYNASHQTEAILGLCAGLRMQSVDTPAHSEVSAGHRRLWRGVRRFRQYTGRRRSSTGRGGSSSLVLWTSTPCRFSGGRIQGNCRPATGWSRFGGDHVTLSQLQEPAAR